MREHGYGLAQWCRRVATDGAYRQTLVTYRIIEPFHRLTDNWTAAAHWIKALLPDRKCARQFHFLSLRPRVGCVFSSTTFLESVRCGADQLEVWRMETTMSWLLRMVEPAKSPHAQQVWRYHYRHAGHLATINAGLWIRADVGRLLAREFAIARFPAVAIHLISIYARRSMLYLES